MMCRLGGAPGKWWTLRAVRLAKQNGLTETELKEAIVHLAFYAGWPSSSTTSFTCDGMRRSSRRLRR